MLSDLGSKPLWGCDYDTDSASCLAEKGRRGTDDLLTHHASWNRTSVLIPYLKTISLHIVCFRTSASPFFLKGTQFMCSSRPPETNTSSREQRDHRNQRPVTQQCTRKTKT